MSFQEELLFHSRSQCTKAVEKSEIGRIFSVVALGQALVPLMSNPLFGSIYNLTLSTLPGAYLLIISTMLTFVAGSSLYILVSTRKNRWKFK